MIKKLAFTLIATAAISATASENKSVNGMTVNDLANYIAETDAKELPKTLNSRMILDRAFSAGNKVKYYVLYDSSQVSDEILDFLRKPEVERDFSEAIKNSVCNSKEEGADAVRYFIKIGGEVVMNYQLTSGIPLYSISIKKCN